MLRKAQMDCLELCKTSQEISKLHLLKPAVHPQRASLPPNATAFPFDLHLSCFLKTVTRSDYRIQGGLIIAVSAWAEVKWWKTKCLPSRKRLTGQGFSFLYFRHTHTHSQIHPNSQISPELSQTFLSVPMCRAIFCRVWTEGRHPCSGPSYPIPKIQLEPGLTAKANWRTGFRLWSTSESFWAVQSCR